MSAKLALEMGEILPAREYLARAVELTPNDAGLKIMLADTSYQVYFSDPGRPTALLREVESMAEELRKRWPALPDGYRLLSQVLMERHRTGEAVDLLRDASAKVPQSETLRAQMAAALFRVGKPDDAASVLWALIESSPNYGDAYDVLYLQLMQRQNRDGAREVLSRKWANTRHLDAALQLAAHDDAQGKRAAVGDFLRGVAPEAAKLPLGLARVGDFWMHRTQWDLAKEAYERGRASEGQHQAEYTGRMAEWYLAQGKKHEARSLVEAEFVAHKDSALLEAYVAAIRLGEVPPERRQEERKRLESILLRMPDSPFVRYHLGRAYMMEKKLQPATEQFERCIKLDANYAPGWVALAEMEMSRSNANAAKQRADMVLRSNPGYLPAVLVSARAQAQRGQFNDARKSFEQILTAQPKNADAIYWLASTYADQRRPDEALKLFAEGRELEASNPRWVLAQVGMLRAMNKIGEARTELEGAIAKGLNAEETLARLAEIQVAMHDGPAAMKSFAQLGERYPQNRDYKLGLAGSAALAGDKDKALALYSELQKFAPADVRVWVQPAALLGEMGRTEASLAAYEEALKRDKANPIVLNNIAYMLLKKGAEPEKALEYAQNAKRIVQRAPEIDDTLAEAYTQLSMHRSAVAIYEEMLSYVPADKKLRIKKLLEAAKQRSAKSGEV